MLRSLEQLQFIISTFQGLEIYFGTQRKMIKMMLDFQAFQFENSIQCGKRDD
ncbi:MAG: hypothetical protein L3J16_04045 [Anaerolineales bacterium]|nr:hypothetical protein [Anaerolineales bacterium]